MVFHKTVKILGEEGINKVQTIHFLDYKRRIEKRLNDSLSELD